MSYRGGALCLMVHEELNIVSYIAQTMNFEQICSRKPDQHLYPLPKTNMLRINSQSIMLYLTGSYSTGLKKNRQNQNASPTGG